MANKNNIDKRISYDGRRTIKDPTYDIYKKGGPVQLEVPLDDRNNNIVPFTPKPGSPILEWYKANKDKITNKEVKYIDDIGPFLSKYYSEKQLKDMDEKTIEGLLQELLNAGVL